MPKHTVRSLDFVTRADPDTGAAVTRLTTPDVTCHRNYFYQKCFSSDGQRLIFGAGFDQAPGGPARWNYHLLDLPSATARQLTDEPAFTLGIIYRCQDNHHRRRGRGEAAAQAYAEAKRWLLRSPDARMGTLLAGLIG